MKRLSLMCLAVLGLAGAVVSAVPSAPSNLTATVTGNVVTLSWIAPPGALLGYRLEAGTAPGLSDLANTTMGTATTFTAHGVPAGTYYVRVRALAVDGESAASNEVIVVVGSGAVCTTPPNPPSNLTATLTGTIVQLAWAAAVGCPATTYILQAGSGPGSSNLAVVNTGNVLGFSATAPPGVYYLRVIAQNAFGSSGPSNEVTLAVGGTTVAMAPLAGTVLANGARLGTVTMPATGTYQATLTWSDPTIDLDLYIASPLCLFYPPIPCLLSVSDATVGNSEQVSWPVRAGERYAIWVDNYSNRASPYVIQQIITTSGATTAPARDGSDAAVAPLIRKARPQPR